MGQSNSTCCCPCLSNEYTQIKDTDVTTHGSCENQPGSAQKGDLQMSSFQQTGNNGNKDSDGIFSNNNGSSSSGANASHTNNGNNQTQSIDYDFNSSVFKGSVVQQKFFNKSTYEAKYAWINIKSRSLCLSEHMTKERRHKEASIGDVTGVICGPPEKYKASQGQSGEPQQLDPNLCLSVKFVRGGGIDLKFTTMKERDDWADVILRMITSMKRSDPGVDPSRLQ